MKTLRERDKTALINKVRGLEALRINGIMTPSNFGLEVYGTGRTPQAYARPGTNLLYALMSSMLVARCYDTQRLRFVITEDGRKLLAALPSNPDRPLDFDDGITEIGAVWEQFEQAKRIGMRKLKS